MMLRVAKVITSGGSRRTVTPRPLQTPIRMAITSVTRMPPSCPIWVIRLPATTPVMVITAATERSIPPIRITSVCPAATMPRNAAVRRVSIV